MAAQTPYTGRELSRIALQVATEASRLILAGFRQRPTVSIKADLSPVTEFDLQSEQLIRQRLAELTPGIAVVGEEEGGQAAGEYTWYCDPIDGTINFMRGHPFFAVSLGVAREGVPFAGAVVAPALRLWWRGSRDDRAYRCEAPCEVSNTDDLGHAVVTSGLPVRGRAVAESGLDVVLRLSPFVRDVRRCGSAAIELCMVADGTYDAYVTRALSPWDTCAGAAILLAAGGRWQAWSEGDRAYELACNSGIHAAVLERLGPLSNVPSNVPSNVQG
jgi:myo-inositol-1(or 4)-monophosphatase